VSANPFEHLATLLRRVRFYLDRARFERELAEEMQFHLEMKARDHEQRGMSRDDAHWAARRRVGNSARVVDATGHVMAVGWVDAAIQDARYALRSLRKSPVFTAVAVLSLALGIGATTAVFTLVNAMLLRPLPFPDAGRLVMTFQTVTPGVFFPVDSMPWSYEKYVRLTTMVPAFADAGFSTWEDYNLRRTGPGAGDAIAERVRAELVTTSLFTTLGARAMIGRAIVPNDSLPAETGTVAVISEPLWRRQFNGDSSVIGQTAVIDRLPITIVGVMPPSFVGIREAAEMWVPLKAVNALAFRERAAQQFEGGMGAVIARLTPDATLAQANAQIVAAAAELNKIYPPQSFGPRTSAWSGGAVTFAEARQHPMIRPLLTVLSIAVGGVLMIVCANIAGLLLARARARESELSVRIALGAGRGRLVRQMLTESVVLALLGGIPGIAIAYGGATLLANLRPTLPHNYILLRSVDLLQGVSLSPDWRVLTFVSILTLVVGAMFGAAPAFAASRTSIAELIKVAGSRSGSGRARGRRALVIGQVALATVLLVGAGLMVRSFRMLMRSDIGFDPTGVVVMRLSGGDTTQASRLRRAELVQRVASLPGIEAAALHNCAPFGSDCSMMPITKLDGRPVERGTIPPIEAHVMTEGYLRTLRIPLRSGRSLGAGEAAAASPTAVLVNETAAKSLWRGESPLGRRIVFASNGDPGAEVVGVVADVKYEGIDAPSRPAVYMSANQIRVGGTVLLARARVSSIDNMVPAIRRVVAATDPSLATYAAATGTGLVARAASSTKFVTILLVGFGVGAALLAALGVYGVLAYLVSQRRREFGVRMAIGAHPRSVLALVVKQGAALTALGLVLGVAGALAATRLLRTFLFGVAPSDWTTYLVIVLVVGAAGLLAALIPAQRATRVDPVIALRE
jgi:predicted permease